jgi:hypothetical protein
LIDKYIVDFMERRLFTGGPPGEHEEQGIEVRYVDDVEDEAQGADVAKVGDVTDG